MSVAVILGGHWGDEGKGKVVDLLADRFEYNVRYGGGANAGHTVVNELGSFALHQVPSGIFHPGVRAVLASGVVVDPTALIEEVAELEGRGVDLSSFYISERAHLVMPYHRALDLAQERMRLGARIGTTGKGMGPAYTDKAAREGLRVGDLLDPASFLEKVRRNAELACARLERVYNAQAPDCAEMLEQVSRWPEALGPRIRDVEHELRTAWHRGSPILLEGAQGALLDLDVGTYPYVTSSQTGAAGALASAGLPPGAVGPVVAVMHAYMTRVGEGPFPTELHDEVGDSIRSAGSEFGTTTGRPRRCGWFDAVASRYAVEVNGATSLALTKLDVLDGLDPVRICVGYRIGGRCTDVFPARAEELAAAEPVYEDLPGWTGPTSGARSWEDLPPGARRYVRRIEELMGAPASIISVGPARGQTFALRDPLEAA